MDESLDNKSKMSRRGFLGGVAAGGVAAGLDIKTAQAQQPGDMPDEPNPDGPMEPMQELGEESVFKYIESLVALYATVDPMVPREKIPEDINTQIDEATEAFLKRHVRENGMGTELSTQAYEVNALVHALEYAISAPRETPLDPRIVAGLARLTKVHATSLAEKSLVIPPYQNRLKIDPKAI